MTLGLAHHAAPAFDATFFAVTATVIPVLWLALAIEVGSFNDIMILVDDVGLRTLRSVRLSDMAWNAPWNKAGILGRLGVAGALISIFALIGVMFLVVGAAFYGELLALLALYRQNPAYDPRARVMAATVILLVAVMIHPVVRLLEPNRLIRRRRAEQTGSAQRKEITPADPEAS